MKKYNYAKAHWKSPSVSRSVPSPKIAMTEDNIRLPQRITVNAPQPASLPAPLNPPAIPFHTVPRSLTPNTLRNILNSTPNARAIPMVRRPLPPARPYPPPRPISPIVSTQPFSPPSRSWPITRDTTINDEVDVDVLYPPITVASSSPPPTINVNWDISANTGVWGYGGGIIPPPTTAPVEEPYEYEEEEPNEIKYMTHDNVLYVNSEDVLKRLDIDDEELYQRFMDIMMEISNRSVDLGNNDPNRIQIGN